MTASGVGIIIGAGIYVLLGAATARAGAGVWLSFAAAALLCALTALSYAELASMFPNAGAEYDYTRHAFPEGVAFLVGWVMAAGLVVAAAAIAVGIGHYLTFFVSVPVGAAAVVLLAAEALLAMRGVRRSGQLTVILSAVQVAGLLMVIVIGAPHVGSVNVVRHLDVHGIWAGAALVFFAFIGFDEVITLAEETRDATRVIPRALLTALAVSAVLYMAVAVAAVSVLGPDRLAGSSRPLVDVVAHVAGNRAEPIVAVVALITTVNTSLLALTAASRLLYGMTGTGAMPAVLGRVSRAGVPAVAVGIAAVMAAVIAAFGTLTAVAGVTDFAVYVVFLAVNATVVVLRVRRPDEARPFRVRGAVGPVPVSAVAGFGAALLMIPRLEGASLAAGAVLLAAGVGFHALGRGGRRPRVGQAISRKGQHDATRHAEQHP